MIVSASRRTDVPALFSDWFYNRVEKGFVLLRNPYNPLQVGRVSLTPDRVDGIVFWTKNAAPMVGRLSELDAFKYYFQYTITPYGRDVEKNIPDKHKVVIPSFKKIGTDKAIWRYDPVFLNERYTWDYHVRAFAKIAEELEGHTHKAVMSFVDSYRTVDLRPLHIQPLTAEQQRDLAQQLSEIASAHGITLTACAESQLGLPMSCCVDGEMFGVKKPKDRKAPDNADNGSKQIGRVGRHRQTRSPPVYRRGHMSQSWRRSGSPQELDRSLISIRRELT